ncbi:MAG: response regulator [Chloroflexi bacterium]|nr:response regulator [Chloroflexota bacterium]
MSKPKVLLAEDDVTMLSLLKTLLNMEGFEVAALLAEADVPEALRTEKPDILLMDVHLANQSGLDILDEIRNTQDVSGVRVIMSSGSNLKHECMKHGANGFLLKPYMPDELIKILQNTLNLPEAQ